jgi:hypothetical protein
LTTEVQIGPNGLTGATCSLAKDAGQRDAHVVDLGLSREVHKMRLPRNIRRRFYYPVADAGAQLGYSRAESYRRAEAGDIPTERDGKFLLVPRRKWDRIVKRLLRGERTINSDSGATAT